MVLLFNDEYFPFSEALYAKHKEWRTKNRGVVADRYKKWARSNTDKIASKDARRRSAKLNATPRWVNHDDLDAIYKEAAKLRLTVDHIVPLRHPLVCGLHVPWNLQLLTKSENSRKNNRIDLDNGDS